MEKENPLTQPCVAEHKIGGTTYIVSSCFKADAKDGLVDKVVRLLENDNRKADTQVSF